VRSEYTHGIGARGLQGYGGLEYTFKSSSYYTSDDSIYSLTHSYGLVNLQLGVRTERWEASLWARNLLDKNYFTALNAPSGVFGSGYVVGTLGDPRALGATLRLNF
jgi:iron complex outermembrane receptor protein